MPMTPVPATGGPSAAPAAPAGPGRKEEPGSPDSAFTAMLMAMMGAQVVPTVALSNQQQAPTGEGDGQNQTPAPGAVPQAAGIVAARLPEELETLLQAQRVAVPAAAPVTITTAADPTPITAPVAQPVPTDVVAKSPVAVAPPAPPAAKPAEAQPQEGVWVVEPLPAAAVAVSVPAHEAGLTKEKGAEQKPATETPAPSAAPAPDAPAFALQAAATYRPEAAASAETHKTPAAIPSPIEPDRLMDAIAKSAVNAGDGRYTVTLRLHPEELGEVRLQLHVQGREVQTSLQVSNPGAQQFLEQRSDQLRDSLNQSGLTLSGFHVATGQEERQRQTEQQFEQFAPRRRGGQTATTGTRAVARTIRSTQRTSGLDTLA